MTYYYTDLQPMTPKVEIRQSAHLTRTVSNHAEEVADYTVHLCHLFASMRDICLVEVDADEIEHGMLTSHA